MDDCIGGGGGGGEGGSGGGVTDSSDGGAGVLCIGGDGKLHSSRIKSFSSSISSQVNCFSRHQSKILVDLIPGVVGE
jgi:hypothetical protein